MTREQLFARIETYQDQGMAGCDNLLRHLPENVLLEVWNLVCQEPDDPLMMIVHRLAQLALVDAVVRNKNRQAEIDA